MYESKNVEYWLECWLQPINPIETVTILKRTYVSIFKLQIAFYVHFVFYDISSKEYIWHVVENYILNEEAFHRSKRYISYETMISDVAKNFKCYSISSNFHAKAT